MRGWRYALFLLVLVAGWQQGQAQPAGAPRAPASQPIPPEYRQRWEQLSPQERQRLLQQYQRWQDLSAAQRQELSDRYRQLQALTPSDREALRRRFDAWRQLSPEERARMQRRLEYWRRLPPPQKEPVLRALWVLKHLLPEEFESFRQANGPRREELRRPLARQLATLLKQPTAELRRLGELPPEARRKAVEKLLGEPPGEGAPSRRSGGTTGEATPGYSAGK
jgi:hypothetical protein